MAFEESLFNVYDPRLKPRLLHSIMMAHLRDEKQLPRSPAQLSVAVASIRRHHLLSETPTSGATGLSKNSDPRKGAVDAWIDHLMGLLCSTVAENRWAGLCLLGVMCQECSRQRFLELYTLWFQKLLLPLKQSTDSVFIRAAACASLTDLLTRLGTLVEHAGVRRDGAALISKLVQPILQILGDKDSSGIWNEVIDLLSAILRYFPACLRQQSNNLESLLVARLMDAESTSLSHKCALSLSLLPKAHGDAATWSSMIRRILIAINTELEYAFTGMEDAASAEDALTTLLPMGQDPPWPLGGPSVAANASAQAAKSFWQQLVPRVGSLLQCCRYLLTNPYPVPVPVPIGPLLTLAMRILRVDGSRLPTPPPVGAPVSSVHQVSLCLEIPALHLSALDLLTAVLCGVRSQLLPHGGDVVRLVSDYFRRCGAVTPVLRIKLYDFACHLFLAMGAGMASALAPAVVGSALADLKGSALGTSVLSPNSARTPRSNVSGWTPGAWNGQPANLRKRKEPGGQPHEQQNNGATENLSNVAEGTATVAVQIAALRALEALLTSGGALLPDRWRAEVDAVLASVAMGAATGSRCASLIFDEDSTYMEGSTSSSSTAFQVAAYRALLASLLSPCCHRPPYLAQGLAIFRKGRQEAGSEVAEVSAHALLALEPLIHPRCLPPLGATSAGFAAGRTVSTGTLVPHMPRPGKLTTTAGTISVVPTTVANINFTGSVVPPTLKIGQIAMDPWAEVDTWLGYGEDFGEDDGFLYEDDNILVDDEFNGSLDRSVGSSGGGYYCSKPQCTNGCSSPPLGKTLRDGENFARSYEENKLLHMKDEESHGGELPPPTLEQDGQRDGNIPSASALSLQVTSRDDRSSPSKSTSLSISQLQSLSYSKDGIAIKTDNISIASGEMNPGDRNVEKGDYFEGGPTGLARPKTLAMGTFSFANIAVDVGAESDSEGVLPDIIDGDPDSD
ncbi:unnamed protein product [Calypogeia fissa]